MRIVILAGGIGTRLWPMSRSTKPKQFYDILSEQPLLRDTFDRVAAAYEKEDIYLAISPTFLDLAKAALPELPDDHFIIEPERRDTGPAMGFVAAVLSLTAPDEPIVFIPADHYIKDVSRFLELLRVGDELIRRDGVLVDIGIPPTFASTALGYTKIGPSCDVVNGVPIFTFAGHTEKPPYEVAKSYLDDGSYLWHANYYMWTPRKFLEAFATYAPDTGAILTQIQEAYQLQGHDRVAMLYAQLPKISFDYAVMEKMDHRNVRILRGDFGWSDIGTWDTLYDRLSGEEKNVVKGNAVLHETDGTLVYASGDRMIATHGVRDLVIVDTPDALLVCHRNSADTLKELLKEVEGKFGDRYL